MCVCVCLCVRACVRVRARARVYVCVCVRERENVEFLGRYILHFEAVLFVKNIWNIGLTLTLKRA